MRCQWIPACEVIERLPGRLRILEIFVMETVGGGVMPGSQTFRTVIERESFNNNFLLDLARSLIYIGQTIMMLNKTTGSGSENEIGRLDPPLPSSNRSLRRG